MNRFSILSLDDISCFCKIHLFYLKDYLKENPRDLYYKEDGCPRLTHNVLKRTIIDHIFYHTSEFDPDDLVYKLSKNIENDLMVEFKKIQPVKYDSIEENTRKRFQDYANTICVPLCAIVIESMYHGDYKRFVSVASANCIDIKDNCIVCEDVTLNTQSGNFSSLLNSLVDNKQENYFTEKYHEGLDPESDFYKTLIASNDFKDALLECKRKLVPSKKKLPKINDWISKVLHSTIFYFVIIVVIGYFGWTYRETIKKIVTSKSVKEDSSSLNQHILSPIINLEEGVVTFPQDSFKIIKFCFIKDSIKKFHVDWSAADSINNTSKLYIKESGWISLKGFSEMNKNDTTIVYNYYLDFCKTLTYWMINRKIESIIDEETIYTKNTRDYFPGHDLFLNKYLETEDYREDFGIDIDYHQKCQVVYYEFERSSSNNMDMKNPEYPILKMIQINDIEKNDE